MSDTDPDVETPPGESGGFSWRDLPFLRGTAAGLVAFLAGYLVTYLLRGGAVDRRLRRPAERGGFFRATYVGGPEAPDAVRDGYNVSASGPREIVGGNLTEVGAAPPSTGRAVGWLFTDLHGVGGSGVHTVATPSTVYEFDLALTLDAGGVLLAFPPLVLLAAGYLVVDRGVAADLDARRAATAGATVAVGYAVAVGLLARLSYWSAVGRPEGFDGDVVFEYAFGPDLLPALAVAGVAYPVVFGGAGGFLAAYFGPTLVGGDDAAGPDDDRRPPTARVAADDPAEWGDDVYAPRDLKDEETSPDRQPGGPREADGTTVAAAPSEADSGSPPGDGPDETTAAAGETGSASDVQTSDGAPAPAGDDGVDYRNADYDERKYMPDPNEEGGE